MPEKELNILLIEDNPDHAELFLANLELTAYAGCRVIQYDSLRAGQERLHSEAFDLFFIDLSLRDSSIPETLEGLAGLGADCPVIVLTSLDDKQTILEIIRKGADDCLPKSELNDVLLERIIHFNLDRWQLKQQLVESREAYRDLYHNSSNMFCSVDAETQEITTCNQTLAKKLCYSRKEILGKNIFALYHPDSLAHVRKCFASFVATGVVTNAELQLMRRDGTKVDVLLNVSAVRDENGKILHSRSTWIDITAKKAAEKKLAYIQRLNRLIIETVPDLLWLKDINGVYLVCNTRMEQLFGVSEVEIVGKTDYDFVDQAQADFFRKNDQIAAAAGRAVMNEEWVTFAVDGVKILLETTRTPMLFEDESVTGVLGIGHDITERYEAAKKSEAASRAKSAFLSSITHELRTPLNAILGYTQILLRDGALAEKQQDGIRTIHHAAEHLLLLINDILDISKIEAGKLEVMEAEVHPLSFLYEIRDIIGVRAKEKGLDFRSHVEGEIPMSIQVDGLRLRQVLLNLLANAIKFTECGYCTLLVRGEYKDNKRVRLTFEVEDSGPGITAEDLEIIFKPFRQVGERLHHSEGSGLGLSICSKLLHLMGGDLQLVSPLEKEPGDGKGPGSRFFFTLEVPILDSEITHTTGQWQQRKEQDISEDCIMPVSEVLDELVALVEVGDINGIRIKIQEICEKDSEKYAIFCSHLLKYFDEFQFTELLNFIAAKRSRE